MATLEISKKKLIYIVNSLNLGGTENLVVQMALAFRLDYQVFVVCLDEPGIWAARLRNENIPVYCLWRQPGIDLAVSAKIAKFCKKHGVDLIHAHQCTAWFYAALSRLLYQAPKLLFEEHGRFYPEHYSWKKNTVNKLLIQNLTSKIVAVSDDVRRRLVKYEGISKNRISVIYNGTRPPPPLSAEKRAVLCQELGLAPDDFVIGMIGRLDPIKNIPIFLKAFAELRLKHKNLKGLLVGDGPDFANIKTMCNSLQISNDILMTGYRQDATDLLQCLNLYVLCSLSEGTSMSLLEAMASGILAIVTNVGGNPELITHHENGWVIPSESTEDLIEAINLAYLSPEIRIQMAQNALDVYENYFSFQKMEDNYKKMYSFLLTGG